MTQKAIYLRTSEILLHYLIKHGQLSLTGIGTLYLRGKQVESEDGKTTSFPEGSLEFVVDPETAEDAGLVAAIAAETGKFKALASADLDSYIQLGKQMMNISNPFVIEKIGILQKNYRNEIEFTPFQLHNLRSESGKKNEEIIEEIRFDDNYLKRVTENDGQATKFLLMLGGLILIILILWGGYRMIRNMKLNSTSNSESVIASPDSDNADANGKKSTVSNAKKTNSQPRYNFKIVLEISRKQRAITRYNDLTQWGHTVIMTTQDSVRFKLAIPIQAPLSDTARHRDSLSLFFGRPVWVELQ